MKKYASIVLIVITMTFIVTSCKKEISAAEILTANSWRYDSMNDNGTEVVLEDCEKDNYLTFATDGTFILNFGTLLCVPGETSYTSTWALSDNDKTLTLGNIGDNQGSSASVEITGSKLVLTYTNGTNVLIVRYISF